MQWDGDPGGERGMRRVWGSWTSPVTLALPHPRVYYPHPSSAGGCAHGQPGWHLEWSWRQLPLIPPAPGLAFISAAKTSHGNLLFCCGNEAWSCIL